MSRTWLSIRVFGACATVAMVAWATPDASSAVRLDRPTTRATTTVTGTVSAMPAKFAKHVAVFFANAPRVAGRGMRATIDQKNIAFVPRVTIVQPGAKVTFVNSDPVTHNVFSPDAVKFDLGNMPPHTSASHVFNRVGSHTLLCHIHPGMIAYLYVSPSGYYAVPDSSGHYTIPNVPDGTYRLTAWSPKLPPQTRTVRLAGRTVHVDFHLHR